MIHLIVAIGSNGAIGRDNGLPWHLPADLAHFKTLTMGHPMIMGRRTFESLPGMLPGRPHIVLTRDTDWRPPHPDVRVYYGIDELLAQLPASDNYFVIGGGQIYREFMPYADVLHITEVDCAPPADTFFPPISPLFWECIKTVEGVVDDKNTYPHRFKTYQKIKNHQ